MTISITKDEVYVIKKALKDATHPGAMSILFKLNRGARRQAEYKSTYKRIKE